MSYTFRGTSRSSCPIPVLGVPLGPHVLYILGTFRGTSRSSCPIHWGTLGPHVLYIGVPLLMS